MAIVDTPINTAVIGCGKGALERHLPAMLRTPGIRIAGAADIDPEKLKFAMDRYQITLGSTDYRDILRRPDIDAVAVLTPTMSHAAVGLEALEADKHLLMEKPLAVNMVECEELVARAEASALTTMVGFNFRWHRLIREARDCIRRGRIGRIQAIRSVYTHWHPGSTAHPWHKEQKYGGGVLFNDGVHHFDLWRFILDREIHQVHTCSRSDGFFDDSTAVMNAVLSDDVLATGVFSFGTSPNSELEIFGDRGRLYVSCYRFDGLQFFSNTVYSGSVRDRLNKLGQAFLHLKRAAPALRHGGDFEMTFQKLWRHFSECVRQNGSPECTFEDGKRAVEIALAAIESSKSGSSVRLR